jgi:Eco29kI restriction endonuclease
MSKSAPYNPLEKRNLGASVAEALLDQQVVPLGQLSTFVGAGVYALYYTGSFEPYGSLSSVNQGANPQAPIYVGKAVPAGGRKGTALDDAPPTRALFKRLKEHAESIDMVSNLKLGDFLCRFLVVDDIWIPLGESLLIAKFSPLWNSSVDGFGNHDPGKGRYQGLVPRWDVLHPGRHWAEKCQPRSETAAHIAQEVTSRLSREPSLALSKFALEQVGNSEPKSR